jgi:hypothetical protein|tara:strand:+ start:2985 stop:3293 length:309 start_codon:yes stop_codon:yes gene_type:complete
MNKFMLILAAALLLAPQFAAAKLSMCVDPHTGGTSFTDKACEAEALRKEVRVDPANLDSGNRSAAKARQKTWKSEVDTRKTGLDFNAERRGLHQNGATASMK